MLETSILVVEDDEGIRTQVTRALELEGHRVHSCVNGKEALSHLVGLTDDRLPSCVILDLMMPVMDGRTFLRVLTEAHPILREKLGIIVATAKGSAINPERLPPGVERVQKPFDLDELLDVIARIAGSRR